MSLASIELLILDVDGVLTDGRIVLGPEGEPGKAFFVQDGYAIKLWQRAGLEAAILSGRSETSVGRRAAELGITRVYTGAADKLAGYESLLRETGRGDAVVAYVGDDLPDLAPMQRCGFSIAVANAAAAVKREADYVTRRSGGAGSAAETVELILRKRGLWTRASS